MEKQQHKKLLVFGYGIALIIPYILTCRILPIKFPFFVFVATLALFLLVLNFIDRPVIKIIYYGFFVYIYLLNILIGVYFLKSGSFLQSIGVGSVILFVFSGACFILIKGNPSALTPVFDLWMCVARFIGQVFSTIILSIIFYFVFTPVGIFLRILKKDLLDQKIEIEKETYWKNISDKQPEREQYLKQF